MFKSVNASVNLNSKVNQIDWDGTKFTIYYNNTCL